MLTHLLIENFILIDRLEMEFGPGFHVLTGETGAGKSIVVDALAIVVGGRAGADVIRTGKERAYLEATFQIPLDSELEGLLAEHGLELLENQLVLARQIAERGSRYRLNGQLVTQGLIRQVGSRLVDIIGQHEQQSLMAASQHLSWLDGYGGTHQVGARATVRQMYRRWQAERRRLEAIMAIRRASERERDFWQFQWQEIADARIRPGEDEALLLERDRLMHMEELQERARTVYSLLYGEGETGSATDYLARALEELRGMARLDPECADLRGQLEEVRSATVDVAQEIRSRSESWEASPERLNEVTDRLDLLQRLKRKYGSTLTAVLHYQEELGTKLQDLESSERQEVLLEEQIAVRSRDLLEAADRLSEMRREAAERLAKTLTREWKDLGFHHAGWATAFRPESPARDVETIAETGWEEAEFLFTANIGQPLQPLVRIASGGELSRVMLALKTLEVGEVSAPTLVFDEIDAGIGGKTAHLVAERLDRVAQHNQVLCITHLPAIAAMADTHWRVEKAVECDHTFVRVAELALPGRIEELALMAGGRVTEAAHKHAAALYERARERKTRKVSY